MIKVITKTFIAFIAVSLLLLVFIATTEPGLLIAYRAAQALLPGKLEIKQLSGTLHHTLSVNDLIYHDANTHLKIANFKLDWQALALLAGRIKIEDLQVNDTQYRLKHSIETQKSGFHFPFVIELEKADIRKLHIKLPKQAAFEIDQLTASVSTNNSLLMIKTIQLASNKSNLKLQGQVNLNPPYQTQLRMQNHGKVDQDLPLNGLTIINGDSNKLALTSDFEAPFASHFEASLENLLDDPQINIHGHWQQIHLPMLGANQLRSIKGKLTVKGNLSAYRFGLSTGLVSDNLPPSQWHLHGKGNAKGLTFHHATAKILRGKLLASGQLNWSPNLNWQLKIKGQALDPASRFTLWPGKFNFSATTSGDLTNSPNVTVNINTLNGELRDYPIEAKGSIHWQPNVLQFSQLHFRAGKANIALNGNLSQSSNLDWRLTIPNLIALLPNSQGSLNSHGHLQGNLSQLQLNGELNAINIRYRDFKLDKLSAQSNLHLTDQTSSTLSLQANNGDWNHWTLNSLKLTATGNKARQVATLEMQSNLADLTAKILGKTSASHQWHTKLETFTINSQQLGDWRLKQPVTWHWQAKQYQINRTCLFNSHESVCLAAKMHDPFNYDWSLSSHEFSLKHLSHWLPNELFLDSQLTANAKLQRRAGQGITGKIQADLSSGELSYPWQDNRQRLQINKGKLKASFDNKGVASQFDLYFSDQQQITASLNIPGYRAPRHLRDNQPINGRLNIRTQQLPIITAFFPEIVPKQGELNAKAQISGTLGKPNLQGELKLENTALAWHRLGIHLTDIEINATAHNNNEITFVTKGRSGKGELTINGKTTFRHGNINIAMQANGKNFEIYNTNEYQLAVTPNLSAKLSNKSLLLEGNVDIPFAKITPRDFSTTVELPSDVKIIETDQATAQNHWQIATKLNIALGRNIYLNLLGLKGNLAGQIRVFKDPGRQTTADGLIQVRNGKYTAYNQDLKIRKGNLIFTGGPIDNPGINVQAVKTIRTVGAPAPDLFSTDPGVTATALPNIASDLTVGLDVSGKLREPRFTLFSEPANYSQSDILSYLLLGHPSGSATADGQVLAGAVSALNFSGTSLSQLTDSLQHNFGIEQIGVENETYIDPETDEVTENTALVLEEELSPKLHVSYSVGLIAPLNTITISYLINQNWSLQSQTNTFANGGDVIYQFER